MAGQLIPPTELAPTPRHRLTSEQRIAAWFEMLDFGADLILSNRRRKEAARLDPRAAFRSWYRENRKEHDQTMRNMMERFRKRETGHGR